MIQTQNQVDFDHVPLNSCRTLQQYCVEYDITINLHVNVFTVKKILSIGLLILVAITTLVLGILANLHLITMPVSAQWAFIGTGILLSLVTSAFSIYLAKKHKEIKALLTAFLANEKNGLYDTDFTAMSADHHPIQSFRYRSSYVQRGEEPRIPLKIIEINIRLQESITRSIHIFTDENAFTSKRDSLYQQHFAFSRGNTWYFQGQNANPF